MKKWFKKEKLERICMVYGSGENIETFLDSENWSGGILGNSESIDCIELVPGTEEYEEIKRLILSWLPKGEQDE